MESYGNNSQKRQKIQQALCESADLLCSYLQFANAHPVDFIVNDLWNTLLPEDIQRELSSLTKEELCRLPSGVSFSTSREQQLQQTKEPSLNCEVLKEVCQGISLDSVCGQDPQNCASACKQPCRPWKQRSIQDFLTAIQKHCIENLECLDVSVTKLKSWLLGNEDQQATSAPFVHAFMNEKKMHEVEVMADVCKRMFEKTCSDVVVDLGSGKGYLSTHLSLQCHLPVLGIDSQPHNTSGAKRRADKLGQQWDSLVKYEVRKSQAHSKSENTTSSFPGGDLPYTAKDVKSNAGESVHSEKNCVEFCNNFQDQCSLFNRSNTTHLDCDKKSKLTPGNMVSKQQFKVNISKQSKRFHEHSNPGGEPNISGSSESNEQPEVTSCTENQSKESKSQLEENMSCAKQTSKSEVEAGFGISSSSQTYKSIPDQETSFQGKSEKLCTKCVALTTYVSADTRLVDLVRDTADILCPSKPPEDLRLFLTGLHTCGPLASNMLRLFVKDCSVKAMCGVGCCYQLMQECFSDESSCRKSEQGLQGSEDGCGDGGEANTVGGDFPMSSILLQKEMRIGRKALDIASLALPRMTQYDGELQGETFYPRALLQAFIHKKLGYIPKDLKKLRKLSKQASDPVDYVTRGICKLNISGCEASVEEVTTFHQQHQHQQEKMAAFFQLRAALGPLVETVVMMDRLLFLLEQDCVEDAFLVKLFDPITSPRCHAIIATKKRAELKT